MAARPGKLAEQVYDTLKAQIHDFQLVAGDRFSEADLGQRLGMSRTPVREALFRLRNEGFLGVESKLGWYVLPIDFGRLEQLYDLRVVLEAASVARLCASTRPSPELDAPEGGVAGAAGRAAGRCAHRRRPRRAVPRHPGARRRQRRDGAGPLGRDRADPHHPPARLHAAPDRIEATYVEHAKILRAVMQRKPDQAQLLLRSHIEQSKAEVRKITLHTLQTARERAAD